jgi:hypothetical protein
MSKEQLKAVLALALGLSIWGGASAQSASTIEGTWTGTAYQNEGTSDTVIITITPTGAESRYPELNCAAKLIRVGAAGDYVFFTEAIIRDGPGGGGNCINGTVTVAPALDKLAWEWFGSFQGKAYVAWGLLAPR